MIKDDNYSKIGLRANYDIFINNHIDVGMSLVVSSTKANPGQGGLLLDAFRAIPIFAPADAEGNFTDPSFINGFTPDNQANPAAKLFYNHQYWPRKSTGNQSFFSQHHYSETVTNR